MRHAGWTTAAVIYRRSWRIRLQEGNTMSFLRKSTLASLAAAALVAAPSAAVASTAQPTRHAAVTQPDNRSRKVCNGDLCMRQMNRTSTHIYIRMWAAKSAFYGHFELTTPSGHHINSPTGVWRVGGWGWIAYARNYGGNYQGDAWQQVGPHKSNQIGQVVTNFRASVK